MDWLKGHKPAPEKALYAESGGSGEPDRYTYQASHMRMTRLMRIMAFCFVISASLNLLQGMLNVKLLDQYRIYPFFITEKGQEKKHIQVVPVTSEVAGYDLVRENFARRMVENLLTVDPVTLNDRLREASQSMESNFYERFKEKQIESDKVDQMTRDGIKRHIYVETAHLLDEGEDSFVYVVDYRQEDIRDFETIKTIYGRAYLEISVLRRNVRFEDRYINPFGFTLLDMSLKLREEDDAETS